MLITKTNEKQTLHYTMQFSFISIQKRRQLDRSSTPSSAPQQNHLYLFIFFDRCLQMFCLSQINQGLTSRYHSLEDSARPVSSHIMKMQKSFWAILLSQQLNAHAVQKWRTYSWLDPQDRLEALSFVWMSILHHCRSCCCSTIGHKTRNLDSITTKVELFIFYGWINISNLHSDL